MNELKEYTERLFEDIKRIGEDGNEYWLARELMPLLEYSKWENFNNVIKKAVIAYKNSNNDDSYWLPEVRKPIITGKGKEEYIIDYKLSRYICYLIVQNANPKKKMVALGQTYFAIQTRKQELSEKEYSELTEDEKRFYQRNLTRKGNISNLEKNIIKILDNKKIPYYQNVNEIKLKSTNMHFLNNKIYDNENDNSLVLYFEILNKKILLMGDAGVNVEKNILEEYNIKNIDILKVGHHGSKTSSNQCFIDKINPKYSIISVGRNNRYNHPNEEVIERLVNSKVYRTDKDGTVEIKINNKIVFQKYIP